MNEDDARQAARRAYIRDLQEAHKRRGPPDWWADAWAADSLESWCEREVRTGMSRAAAVRTFFEAALEAWSQHGNPLPLARLLRSDEPLSHYQREAAANALEIMHMRSTRGRGRPRRSGNRDRSLVRRAAFLIEVEKGAWRRENARAGQDPAKVRVPKEVTEGIAEHVVASMNGAPEGENARFELVCDALEEVRKGRTRLTPI